MRLAITSLLVLFLGVAQAASMAAPIKPAFKHVTLERFTSLVVEIPPDHGTRFIFPFVLDEKDEFVPFTMDNTNSAIFTSSRKEGRNSFVISVPAPSQGGSLPTYHGNLFITVAGYNLSVLLKTTNDLKKHFSDVVFELSEKEQQDTIARQIEREKQKLQSDYAAREAQFDQQVDSRMLANLGQLALNGSDDDNIKESRRIDIGADESVELYVDKALRYGSFTSIVFEIKNETVNTDLVIEDVRLFGIKDDTPDQVIASAIKMPPSVRAKSETRGVLTSAVDVLAFNRLKLVLLTDHGEFDIKW